MSLSVRIVGMILGAVFGAAGLSVAFSLLPLVAIVGIVAAMGTYSAKQDNGGAPGSHAGHQARSLAVLTAVGTIAAVYVVIGIVVLLGAAIGALLIASLLALSAYRALRDRRAEPSPNPVPAPRAAPDHVPERRALLPADVAGSSTAELCRAWRVSYLALQNVRNPQEWAELATMRRRYLDELERRDPDGFRRWLEDGARAASDPARYIRTGSVAPQQEDDAAA